MPDIRAGKERSRHETLSNVHFDPAGAEAETTIAARQNVSKDRARCIGSPRDGSVDFNFFI